jgi:hypothetical protein
MTFAQGDRSMNRLPYLVGLLVASIYVALASAAQASPRLFTVTTGQGVICEIDPVAATEIFSFHTVGTGSHPGLAFNGTELFYTDETLPVIKVFLPDGTFLRDLPKPGNPLAGGGLGVSKTSLYVVGDFDDTITAISPLDGSVQGSFAIPGAKEALTYAGSRGTMFVRVGDGAQLAEVTQAGTVVNTITIPVNITGLAFSSSANRLFGVVTGKVYALDPDTGALLPGYPVDVYGAEGYRVPKTGAAAADESEPPEICGNMIDDDANGLVDCEDARCDCLPIGKDPGVIRFAEPGAGQDYLMVHGSLSPTEALDVLGDSTGILLTNANGTIFSAELAGGSLVARSNVFFKFLDRTARATRNGIWKIEVRQRRRGGYTFRVKAYGDLSAATDPVMTVQWHLGGQVFVNHGTWAKTSRGWKLHLPGE